jgi:hypothetical protein
MEQKSINEVGFWDRLKGNEAGIVSSYQKILKKLYDDFIADSEKMFGVKGAAAVKKLLATHNSSSKDFLDKVEQGEAENDFTKGYKDQELKRKIDDEKGGEQGEGEPDDMNFDLPDFPEPQTNSDKRIEGVLDAIVDMLNTDKEDIKRQFPTEKSAKSFVSLLSPNELDFIITQVGLSESLSRFEKQKLITSNFIIELENI